MAMTRTFLAIELDEPTRAYIRARVSALTPALPGVRFVAAATWHITLAFLGELADDQLTAARAAAHDAAATTVPFTLHAGRVGTFGPDNAPLVIWLGVGGMTTALFALQRQVVTALHAHDVRFDETHYAPHLHAHDIPFDETHYAPHITLARLHHPLTPAAAQALITLKTAESQGPALSVTAISVMKSELSPAGARYTALDRAPLGE